MVSATGALVRAYTGPTLYYAVGRLTDGLTTVFGSSVSKGMDLLVGANDSDDILFAAYARAGEIAGDATARGLSKVLEMASELFGDSNVKNADKDLFLSTPSTTNSTPNSLTISKTKSSNGVAKLSVSITSSAIDKS